MAHRKVHSDPPHRAGRAHLNTGVLTRVQSAVIFGSISSGLLACALGAFVYDIGRAVAAW